MDAPAIAFAVCAKGDWLSRLAAFAVAMQTGRHVIIASGQVCRYCLTEIADSAPSAEVMTMC